MARKRYNTAAIDRRRAAVAAYRHRGYSLREIVDALPKGMVDEYNSDGTPRRWRIEQITNSAGKPYDLATIQRDVDALTQDWQQSAHREIAEMKAETVAQIEYGMRRALDGPKESLYYFFRGLELKAQILRLGEDVGEDLASKMGAFLAGVNHVTGGDVPDLSEPPGSTSGVPGGLSDEPGPNGNGHGSP